MRTEFCRSYSQFLQLLIQFILKLVKLFLVFNLGGIQVSLYLCPDARLKPLKLILGSEFAIQAMLKVRNGLVQLCLGNRYFTKKALVNDLAGLCPRGFGSQLINVRFMLESQDLIFLP
jgi:hypothetical protein